MDRGAIARRRRRSQALELLEFERERERALAEQLETIVVEQVGGRVDEEAFARMAPEEVAIVRELLDDGSWALELEDEGDGAHPCSELDAEADGGDDEEEIARLEALLAACRANQRALERFVEALGDPAGAAVGDRSRDL